MNDLSKYGVMFHHFHGAQHPKVEGSISQDDMDQMFLYLKRNHQILPARQWYDLYLADKLEPNSICITFDDALKCQYDIAKPVLDAHGITGFWFVYTSPLEGNSEKLEIYRYFKNTMFADSEEFYKAFYVAADSEEVEKARISPQAQTHFAEFSFYTLGDRVFRYVRDKVLGREKYYRVMDRMLELAKFDISGLHDLLWMKKDDVKNLHNEGHIIGLHSHTHPTDIGSLPIEKQAEEYEKNFASLTRITGEKPYTSSHPSNSYSLETIELLKRMGIVLSFRANMQYVPGQYTIPREDHIIFYKRMKNENSNLHQ